MRISLFLVLSVMLCVDALADSGIDWTAYSDEYLMNTITDLQEMLDEAQSEINRRNASSDLNAQKNEIEEIQQRLVSLGYLNSNHHSGIYDDQTTDAIKNFQSWNVLEISGKLDKDTRELIMSDKADRFPKNLGIETQSFINELSKNRRIVDLPEIHYDLNDTEKYSRALNISIDAYNSVVIMQCGGLVQSFIMLGTGDDSQLSGACILLTFSSAMAASNTEINNKEANKYMLDFASNGDGHLTINGVEYTFSRPGYVGNMLTVNPVNG